MLSKYFFKKVSSEKFIDNLNNILNVLKDKKVIIYGAGQGFAYLFEKFPFKCLNIIAIADKKFKNETTFQEIKAIPPEQISSQDYDVILVTNEQSKLIGFYLNTDLKIEEKKLVYIFNEDIKDEISSVLYLEKFNFTKNLQKLKAKFKNKKIILYGAGAFFEAIKEYYDLSGLNIIGISDKKFENHQLNEEFLGYKVYAPDEIKGAKPDVVLVSTRYYINIIEDLYYNTLKGSKIKLKPLLKKPFIELIHEIWS